jgi:limonene-1,2-epoxide hydrolase
LIEAAVEEADTGLAVIANVAVVLPAATVTLAGTAAAMLVLERATAIPPAGAAEDSVTVPVAPIPLIGKVVLTDRADRATATGGVIVRVPVFVTPP